MQSRLEVHYCSEEGKVPKLHPEVLAEYKEWMRKDELQNPFDDPRRKPDFTNFTLMNSLYIAPQYVCHCDS